MVITHIKKLVLFGYLSLVSGFAQAQWYVGGALAQAESDQGSAFDILPATETDDSSDIAGKLFVGFSFSESLTAELSFVDVGDEYGTFNLLGNNEKTEMEVSAVTATFLGRVSVHQHVDFFGRLGMALWDVDVSYSEPGFSSSGIDNDLDLVDGLGFAWRVNEALAIRFEWEQIQNVGDEVETDLSAGSILQINGQDYNIMAVGIEYSY